MHGEARGLVDREDVLVLEQDRQLERGRRRLARLALGHADRGDADAVAEGELARGVDPARVHAHLAAAQDAVDVALGNALEVGEQEIVDALAGAALVDLDIAHRALGGGGVFAFGDHGRYTICC